jgi:hypothetical protein
MQSKLKKDFFESAIYKSEYNYHPKVYLFKVKDTYTAFVGSSNLTDGGLEDNVELNYKITNQEECLSILDWICQLYKDAYPLSEENILSYEDQFNYIKQIEGELKKRRKFIKLRKPTTIITINPLDSIDFSDRYFKKEHHWAFRRELWADSSTKANIERHESQLKFLELNEMIFSKFNKYGIEELDHNVKNHIVSMSYHLEGATTQNLGAMWLSYGKTQQEIKKYKKLFTKVPNKKYSDEENDKTSFINHARLQIRIELASIGIWLLFGKNNDGSSFDRKNFFDKMKTQSYRDEFFKKITSLPNKYWIRVDDIYKDCNSFKNPEELHLFCKNDSPKKYFIIGRDYKITDVEMSEDNLPKETLKVFQLLYPLYDMMIDKLNN